MPTRRRHALLAVALAFAASCGSHAKKAPQEPVTVEGNVVTIPTAEGRVRVSAPLPGALRVQVSPPGQAAPTVTSFAVDPATVASPGAVTVDEANGFVTVKAGDAAVRVRRAPLRVALLDAAGAVVAEQPLGSTFSPPLSTTWSLRPGTQVFGLGDKAGTYDRRGFGYDNWNSDHYGWDAARLDPLYKTIPFLMFLDGGNAHGYFLDNPSRSYFDVGFSDLGRVKIDVARAPVWDLYLFPGPDPKAVLAAYTALTGRTPLPPRWALGYHQSRYSYLTSTEVRDVAAKLRADAIPADAIWLDIDFQLGNRPFTVDPAAFPDFPAMVTDLTSAKLRTVVITDPHPKQEVGYAPYDSGLAADVFVRKSDGQLFVGNVWPGASVFPDFGLQSVRTWWGGLYGSFVGQGVAGFWNDMNEPAIFASSMPDDTPHRLDGGTTVDHLTFHNAYGLMNARATHEGVLALRPGVRPFVLTRAAYAGAQRWAASWTGDNKATREHLAITIPQLVNLGVSGYAFMGADVGGFVGCPDDDLLVEWTELGALQPFFRNHSEKGSCRREPWVRGAAVEARIRAAIERRYRLLPYLYTAFEETARTGLPVMRPLWLAWPGDAAARANARAYLLGPDLVVAPKLDAGVSSWQVTLPAADFFDTATGALVAGGGSVTVTPVAGEGVRLFARAGAIVPSQPVTATAAETPAGPLTVDVWPGAACAGALYLDAGDGFGQAAADARRVAYACTPGTASVTVTSQTAAGTYPTWWSETRLVVHGVPSAPVTVKKGDAAVPFTYDAAGKAATVTLAGGGADWAVQLAW
ncbi:MAG: glycoside hydrolase family 31 protein [Anaeromyxobacter sp.]